MPSRPGSPYNTALYRRLKAEFIASAAPVCAYERCPVPNRYIDTSLSGNHPLGPSVDHRVPTSKGGPMWSGWQLVHRACNSSKGARLQAPPVRTSRRW